MELWTSDYWEENMDVCKEEMKKNGFWEKIPLMNRRLCHNLKEGQFVRFCGMIQDMYNPVYYLASYEVHNTITDEKTTRSGKYKDSLQCAEHERILFDSAASVNQERRPIYCISVPAMNLWAENKKCELSFNTNCGSQHSSGMGLKRNAGEAVGIPHNDSRISSSYEPSKRHCVSVNVLETNTKVQPVDLNLPIPDIQAEACLINFYDIEENQLKINDVIEVAGFLSYDSGLITSVDGIVEQIPPHSLVPRIHAVAFHHLCFCNPLITPQVSLNDVLLNASRLRDELKLVMTQLLMGDKLAADYLICHLISYIYLRQDMLVLGKFSLNLSNIPHSSDYTSRLYHFLEYLVVKSHYLPMTLENMNTLNFIPRKNYETNCLESGLLQLSNKTHLVLDETLLQPGQLNERGVRNCRGLAAVITNQRLEYDFQFYPVEFNTDIPILILSEGKSMLPSDYHVKIAADTACISTVNEVFAAVTHYLKEPLLSQLRVYLSLVSTAEYNLTTEVQQIVQEDFVQMRRDQPKTSAQDLHSLLVLARFLSLSHGSRNLTKEFWETARQMEYQRKARLIHNHH